jgi:hypothetical protein
MGPSVAASLKTLSWTAITAGLAAVATTWARLCVDRLPVKGQTLESLQADYRALFEAMPGSEAAEVETALRQFTRALRLKGDQVSATQQRYVQEQLGLRRFGQLSGYALEIKSAEGTYEYLEPVFDVDGSVVQGITFGALLYVVSHRALGALYPTFTEPLRDQLCDVRRQPALINERGLLKLEPLIAAHSHWVASLTHQRKGEPLVLARADRPDYGDYPEEQTTGSWLDDWRADESEDEESSRPEWPVAHRRLRP